MNHPRFRAAYDFLLIREKASKDETFIGKWWTDFQKNDDNLKKKLLTDIKNINEKESSKKFGFFNELI